MKTTWNRQRKKLNPNVRAIILCVLYSLSVYTLLSMHARCVVARKCKSIVRHTKAVKFLFICAANKKFLTRFLISFDSYYLQLESFFFCLRPVQFVCHDICRSPRALPFQMYSCHFFISRSVFFLCLPFVSVFSRLRYQHTCSHLFNRYALYCTLKTI